MTRQEAFTAMQNGQKVAHDNFMSDEYYHLVNDKIKAEDGVNHTEVFWSKDQDNWRKDNWHLFIPL